MNKFSVSLQEFCERSGVEPTEVQQVWKELNTVGCWLGGGAIRRTLIKQPLDSDFDFFFNSVDSKDQFVERTKGLGFSITRETKHHTELKGKLSNSEIPIIVQAIHFKYYNNTEEVLDSFDYTISQFVYDGDNLHTTTEALWDLGRRKLALHRVTYPVATMRRMLKYCNQGFTACGGCMADLYVKTMDNPDALGELDIAYVD